MIFNSCSYMGCEGNCMKLSEHNQGTCESTSTHFKDYLIYSNFTKSQNSRFPQNFDIGKTF